MYCSSCAATVKINIYCKTLNFAATNDAAVRTCVGARVCTCTQTFITLESFITFFYLLQTLFC